MTAQPPPPSRYSRTDSFERNLQRIRLRQDTEEAWLKNNPVPASGEMCYTIGSGDAGRVLKVGDGTLRWDQLPYLMATGSSGPPGPSGIDGHSITVYGPSASPPAPANTQLFKGDIWLADGIYARNPSFDASLVTPGAKGDKGDAATIDSVSAVRLPNGSVPTAVNNGDTHNAQIVFGIPEGDLGPQGIPGIQGPPGPQGPAGDTFQISGAVADDTALPATPPALTVYITQNDSHLHIYDPTSAAAEANGYVDLGAIAGPQGPPSYISSPVATQSALPNPGQPGMSVLVQDTGHLWSWNELAQVWSDSGEIRGPVGLGALVGTVDGQIGVWDTTTQEYQPTLLTLNTVTDVDVKKQADGSLLSDKNILYYEAASQHWVAGELWPLIQSNFDLDHITDVDVTNPLLNDVLTYDKARKRWVNSSLNIPAANALDIMEQHDGSPLEDADIIHYDLSDQVWKAISIRQYLDEEVNLSNIGDVTISGGSQPLPGQALTYAYVDAADPSKGGYWHNTTPIEHLSELTDVDDATAPTDGQALVWDAAAGLWKPGSVATTATTTVAPGTSTAARGVGEIIPWMSDTLPNDYLPCDGRIVAIGNFPELHAVIGNKYNPGTLADGTTTFALPDLRGYFLRGIADDDSVDKDGVRPIGAYQQDATGQSQNTIHVKDDGEHIHQMQTGGMPYSNSHSQGGFPSGGGASPTTVGGNVEPILPDGQHKHDILGFDAETRPKNVAVHWVIRVIAVNGGAVGPAGPASLRIDGTNAMAADADMGGNRITNLAAVPVDPTDAVNKHYLEHLINNLVTGLSHNVPVEAILNDPPTTAAFGEFFIVGKHPTGEWVGHENKVAFKDASAANQAVHPWHFYAPPQGEARLVEAEGAVHVFNGLEWVKISPTGNTDKHLAEYDPVFMYQEGSTVTVGDQIYRAKIANMANQPDLFKSTNAWELLGCIEPVKPTAHHTGDFNGVMFPIKDGDVINIVGGFYVSPGSTGDLFPRLLMKNSDGSWTNLNDSFIYHIWHHNLTNNGTGTYAGQVTSPGKANLVGFPPNPGYPGHFDAKISKVGGWFYVDCQTTNKSGGSLVQDQLMFEVAASKDDVAEWGFGTTDPNSGVTFWAKEH